MLDGLDVLNIVKVLRYGWSLSFIDVLMQWFPIVLLHLMSYWNSTSPIYYFSLSFTILPRGREILDYDCEKSKVKKWNAYGEESMVDEFFYE